jgi:hypothetical protein
MNGLRGILLHNVAGMSSNPFSPAANEPKVVVNSDQGLLVRRGVDGRDLGKGSRSATGEDLEFPPFDLSSQIFDRKPLFAN